MIKQIFSYKLLLIVAVFFWSGCEKIFLKPTPKTDPVSIFDEYWTIINDKYSFFELKGVNWDEVYDIYRPLVNDDTSDEELFTILGNMGMILKDGHVSITNSITQRSLRYDGYVAPFPENFNPFIIQNNYLNLWDARWIGTPQDFFWWNIEGETPFIRYSNLLGNLGYVRISTFDIAIEDDDLESMVQFFSQKDGIIIDVRSNRGGSPKTAAKIASYLTSSEVYTGYERFKIGPGADDFSENIDLILKPADQRSNNIPLAILTNRGSYSATSLFVHHLMARDNVKIIGDQTGGGGGSVMDGVLANGWVYSLSVSQLYDSEGRNIENGIMPDISVNLDPTQVSQGIDTIIERAIDEL